MNSSAEEDALSRLKLPPWFTKPVLAKTLIIDNPQFGEVVHDMPIDRDKWHFAPRYIEQRAIEIWVGQQ